MAIICAATSRDRLCALVVAEDEALWDAVRRALRPEGAELHRAVDASAALTRLSAHRVDALVVADPDLCARLRATAPGPIMLLVCGDAERRVAGFEAGADDCLSRPFHGPELVARLRSMVRRADRPFGEATRAYADLRLDRRAHRSWRGERELGLTPTEFALLDFLVEHAEQVVGRSRIFTEVWGYDFGSSSNGLGVYVSYLRRKLEQAGEPRLLQTVRGVGYVLRER